MSLPRSSLLSGFLFLVLCPGASRCESFAETELTYSTEAENVVLTVRRTRRIESCDQFSERTKTYRVFGDGRVEIDPVPDGFRDVPLVLAPELVEQLLHSVDAILNLGDLHLAEPEDVDAESFVEVQLDRLVSPKHAIHYLDVRAVSGLDAVFEDLAAIEKSLLHSAASRLGRPIWVSGNPWPRACQSEHRQEIGHRVLDPGWCAPPAFRRFAPGPFDGDEASRERVRERLRERLRTLPRSEPSAEPPCHGG